MELNFFDVDLSQMLKHLAQLLIAYALALPIGWDRETSARSAGLRTFPLVAMASCGFMITGLDVLQDDSAHARVMYGIITGIGFIGGGAILKSGGNVAGTATAASLWNTGAIGLAVAWYNYEIAIALSAMNFLTLRVLGPMKGMFAHSRPGDGADKQDKNESG